MAVIGVKSITGITSITNAAGADVLTFHSNNTTERVRITADGSVNIGGNLTLPAYTYHDGDSDTYYGFSGDNQFSVFAGGAERLKVVSSQTTLNGTTDGVLQINTTDSRGAFARFGQGGTYHHMIGCADGLVVGPDKEDLGLRAADNMVFCTNGANERLRITSGGSVNLGTGELTQTARKFNVYGGAARVTQTAGGNTIEAFGHTASGASYGLLVNAGSTSADYAAEFRNKDATTLLRIRGDGNVGINESSPNRLLYISDDSNTAYSSTSGSNGAVLRLHNKNGTDNSGVNNQVGIEMYVANGATTVGMLSMVRTGNNTGDFTYKTRTGSSSYAERLRITSNGALGTNSIVRSAYGGLDLQSQGATNLGTLTLGASGGQNGTNRNSNTENQFRIMCPTYANPSNMFTVMYGASGSSLHEINYGGGTGWAYAANLHRFFTAANQTTGTGTERLRINSDSSILHTRTDNVQRHDVEFRQTGGIGTGNFGGIKWTQGSTGGTFLAGITIAYHDTGRPAMVFYQRDGSGTGSRQTVNIDRDGTMIIGESTDAALAVNQSTGRGVNLTASGRVYCKTADHWDLNRVGTGEIIRFRKGADSGTQTHVGHITVNSSSVTFSQTASDSRLKKNIETWTDEVLPHFKTLQPKKFNFNWESDTDTKTKGYVAQDLTSVFPEAYPMSKVDVDGSEEDRYMFAPGGMVTYLMKALQEEIAKREALEARIAALESS